MDKGTTQEAAEPKVSEEQLSEIDDVLDIADEPEEKPAEQKPAEKEADKAQPSDGKPAEDAKGKDGTGQEPKDELADKGAETTEAKKEETAGVKTKDDPEFEMATKDGVRNVKLSALKTTYMQHGALQAKHLAIKPCLDLFDQANIPPNRMFEFLVAGIQAVHESAQRRQTPPGSTQDAKPQGYQGPFESEEQEAQLKDSDPILFRSVKAMWDQNRALSEQIVNLTGKLEQAHQERPAQPAPTNAGPSPERKRVDGILDGLAKTHAEYFKAHPERADAFKFFLGTKFSSVPLDSVDENFLTVAFQTFDPAYYAAWHKEQVRAELEKGRQLRRRTFGETDSVRGSVAASMTEQQEHMADILDF